MNDHSPFLGGAMLCPDGPLFPARAAPAVPQLGVVIVTFNSGEVILECLESLLASPGVRLRIVVVDNDSTDDTVHRIRRWAAGRLAFRASSDLPFELVPVAKPLSLAETHCTRPMPDEADLMLLHAGVNGGYAAGVNAGLACLAMTDALDRFWILNPDSAVDPRTPLRFAMSGGPAARFAIMGGRLNYMAEPERIQIDGGRIDWRTGVTSNLNQGANARECAAPDGSEMDFVSGASMVVSREFYEKAGPMPEDYFLYYEEVDWALRRGDLPLVYCGGAVVYHRAGTAIGSPTPGKVGSAMSIYFKHRNRMRFLGRYRRRSWFTAQAFSLAKAGQILLRGHPYEALVLLLAALGTPPTKGVREKLSPEAGQIAFTSWRGT